MGQTHARQGESDQFNQVGFVVNDEDARYGHNSELKGKCLTSPSEQGR